MGKLKRFYVQLEHPQAVYYPGQKMNGILFVESLKEMIVKDIRVTFQGIADVQWNKVKRHGWGTYSSLSTDPELYLDQNVLLYGKGAGMGNKKCFPPGKYVLSFSFTLPKNLPSSFQGNHGLVRYIVSGIIETSKKKIHETEHHFTIVSGLDLNRAPNSACGIQKQEDKYILCCFCCTSGTISCKLKIDKSGYIPGETISFHAEIKNFSGKICKNHVKFYQISTYRTKKAFRTSEKVLEKVKHQRVQPGRFESWTGEFSISPASPPLNLEESSKDVDYFVELVAVPINSLGKNIHVPIKIIIGTDNQRGQLASGLSRLELEVPGDPRLQSVHPTARESDTFNIESSSFHERIFCDEDMK
ncbi:arrestin domain-containing protein 3-like [Saccostrea cucullata]|uniref:arrestin domain-containing protein 3-like n=1 Tax=Saccostrea cuccullata TaxID=36930 RepID=UPI002ED06BD6